MPIQNHGVPTSPRGFEIEHGWAMTPNIPKDVWDRWMQQIGHDFDPVRNGFVFAFESRKDCMAKAHEHENMFCNFQPLTPMQLNALGQPIGTVDPRTKSFRQVATADELAAKMGIENNSVPITKGISGSAAEQQVTGTPSLSTMTLAKG
jgi:hypothetical protein